MKTDKPKQKKNREDSLKIKGTLDDVLRVAVKGNPKPKKKSINK